MDGTLTKTSLVDEIDGRQNEVMRQIDELNTQIESTIHEILRDAEVVVS